MDECSGALGDGWHSGGVSVADISYEKLGQFYLGKEYDLDAGEVGEDLLMYDSKDLVTHGVVLGMTGSGKTGLCISLLEEAAMDHVPAIVIDPKGDISNLLLTFPEMRGADFEPWVNPDDAAKKGVSVAEHAERTAAMWKAGLAEWGQGPERVAEFKKRVDINIFTPGSSAGIPVSILSSLGAPPAEVMEDRELFGDQVSSTVESLLSLIGVGSGGSQSREAVLLGAIFMEEWGAGRGLSLESLIGKVQRPGFGKVGVIDLESFYPEKERMDLVMRFNSLLASPGFSAWLEGAPLDVGRMLHREDGKPRISIFSIAHLSDAERMFFVSLLLNQMLGWMRTQRGTTSLRALLYMDEIYGFLPPTANPPSKRPMMTMLKQARAFGLGCLLATQNPVDLDYKALSNIGTWFLGRLQTERDKARVLDGLEGAAASQNAEFSRKKLEVMLSGLGNRVFLMNNVHEDGPVLFHVRWVMSFLTGPLTRGQIKGLMDVKRGNFLKVPLGRGEEVVNPMARGGTGNVGGGRPVLGAGVVERFGELAGEVYRPYLFREGTVHFVHSKGGVTGERKVFRANPILGDGIDWDAVREVELAGISAEPEDGVGFAELPGYAMNAKNYRAVKKEFSDELYRNEREEIWYCAAVKRYGEIGETEGDFRLRIAQDVRELRDDELEEIRERAAKKVRTLERRLRAAEARVAKEQAEASSAKMQAGISVLGGVMKSLFGRKAGFGARGAAGSVRRATRAYKQHQDVANAEERVEEIEQDMEELREETEREVAEVTASFDPSVLELEREVLKPRRTDVDVREVGLLWM